MLAITEIPECIPQCVAIFWREVPSEVIDPNNVFLPNSSIPVKKHAGLLPRLADGEDEDQDHYECRNRGGQPEYPSLGRLVLSERVEVDVVLDRIGEAARSAPAAIEEASLGGSDDADDGEGDKDVLGEGRGPEIAGLG